MIKRHQIAVFVNTAAPEASAPTWTRIKKSTELTISMDAQTEDFDYIADEGPTTELTGYKPSIDQPLKMIEGEPDFTYFWNLFYGMKVGEQAKTDYLIAFMFDQVGSASPAAYRAWSGKSTITFNELNANDSELTFNMSIGGDVKKGSVTVTGTAPNYIPVFTEGEG